MGKPRTRTVLPAAPARNDGTVAVMGKDETPLKNGFKKIVIEGKVGKSIPRSGLEKKLPLPGSAEVGLPGYDRYHLAGPNATGYEEGIVYAPKNFNVSKTKELENLLLEAQKTAELTGGEAYVTIKAIVKEWKVVDGVTIRVLKEIEWTIEIRLPGSDELMPMLMEDRYYLKEPPAEPKLWADYVPEAAQGIASFAAPIIIQEFIHKPAVEKRVMDQTKERGYVSFDAPSEQGFLYDLGAWLLDPFRDAEFSVGMDKRFDVRIWRQRLKQAANAKKPGETMEIEWDVGLCQKDVLQPGRQVIEKRRIVYRKQADGSWKVQSGDDAGTPDLDFILSDDNSDADVRSRLFSNPCAA